MITDVRQWLRIVWPTKADVVARDYAALGKLKFALADIALRGHVFTAMPAKSELELAINEGRRQLALELIKLAGEDPVRIFALVERPPSPKEKT